MSDTLIAIGLTLINIGSAVMIAGMILVFIGVNL